MQQEEIGFFKSLFDFNLKHFITLKVIRLLYGISVVTIVLLGVLLITVSFAGGGDAGSYKFLTLILTPVGVLFYIIMARLWVEFLANFYRIGDNVQKIVDNLPAE
jgi:hypothetical protein